MIPVHLRISGFLSYLDPVDIDFTGFDIACISGANGAGKSSLLDAMTWSLFGQARRRDDALINSRAKNAEVIFDLEYEGNLYRVQRIKPREKPVVLEFFVRAADGNWKTLTERSSRETEARIQSSLRLDYETFINASFFLQGKADLFAQQRPGDRKRILSAILGLEIWETYRTGASERRKQLEAEQAGLDNLINEIQGELNQEDARRKRLTELEEQLASLQELRKARESTLEAQRRLAASLAEQKRLLDVLGEQRGAALNRQRERASQLAARQAEQQGFQAQLNAEVEIRAAYQAWQDCRAELERWDAVAANFRQYEQQRSSPLLAIQTENARLEQERKTLLAEEKAVNDACGRLPVVTAQLAEHHAAVESLAARLNQRPQLEADLRGLQNAAAEAQAENRRLRDEMNELKERINHLKEIGGGICPLCGQPLSDDELHNLIASLEKQGRDMGDRFRGNQERAKTSETTRQKLEQELQGFSILETQLRTSHRSLDQLEDQLTQIQTSQAAWESGGALRLQEVTAMISTDGYALEARAELARIDAALKDLGYDAAEHDRVRKSEQAGRQSEADLRALESARAALGPLEREISRLETQLAEDTAEAQKQEAAFKLAEAKYLADSANAPDVDRAERELFDLQEQENRMRYNVGGARQAVQVLENLRDRRAKLGEQRNQIVSQVAQLKTLERAFGRDGVPALLIEQALPEIETLANEILDRLSGGAMSVRFETQRDYKDRSREDKRETLDIIISDASGPREYELFSGGEAFRVNFAIRLALSRFLAQRAGARLQTLVIDEGFGSQDVEGRQRLIEAINMVRPDFAKILAITHMEELKEAFPMRIEVEKTARGSTVRVMA